jgi:hypothetical protein
VVRGGARAGAVARAAAVGQAAVVTHLHRQVPDSDAGGHGLWLGRAELLERRDGGGGGGVLISGGGAADAGTNTTSATILLVVCGGNRGGGSGGRVLVVLELVHCPLEERARVLLHMSIHHLSILSSRRAA